MKALLLACALAALIATPVAGGPSHYSISLPNGRTIRAEVPASKARGLMWREELCADCGMIFIYSREWFYGFWMKNTLIPLAMVWIDAEGTIVHIVPEAAPCGNPDPDFNGCPSYRPKAPGKYVLEINPEAARGLEAGMKLSSLPPLP